MSTTEVLKRGGADLQSTDERARAAVKNFHHMQPSLTAYARALTGKSDVQVVVSPNSNGHTDGKKIFFRPPLALGDNTPHVRALCDKRDPDTLRQTCPACDVREQVLIVIYHEIAHIAQGSFEEMSEYDRAQALDYGLSLIDRKYADAVKHRVAHADSRAKMTYIGMAGLISPYLPGVVNALEDARVNAAAARARRGTRVMFAVDTMRVLSEGFEQKMPDGTVETVYWNTRPLNAQMICALYARAAGYPMEQFFVPEVIAALDDPKVKEILSDFPTIRNAKGVYVIAIALLMRLRELGFYQHHTDPTSEPEDSSDEPEEEQPEQESSDEGGTGDGDGQDASNDPSGSDGVGEPQPAGEDDSERESGDRDGSPEEDQTDSGTEDGSSESSDSDNTSDQSEGSDGGTEESESGSPTGGPDKQEQSNDDGSPSDDKGNSDGEGQSRGSDEGDDATSDGSKDQDSHASADGSEDDDASTGGADESEVGSDGEEGTGDGSAEAGDDQGSTPDESSDSSGISKGRELREEGDASGDEAGDRSDPGAGSDHQPDEASEVPGDNDHGDLGEGEPEDVGTGDSGGTASPPDSTGALNEGGPNLAGTNPEDADEVSTDPVAEGPEDGDSDGGRDDSDPTGEEEVIDTGADEGLGGVEIIENSAFDRLPMGEPEEVNGTIHEIAHPEERPSHVYEEEAASKEMEVAIIQGLYFETPSRNIRGVREHYYDSPIYEDGHNMSSGWDTTGYSHWGYSRRQLGVEGDFDCDEKTLGPALLKMRVAFADNKRATRQQHRKSGKINNRVLGKRAALGDPRLFQKRTIPGKKDYFVLIGIDISGSTVGRNIVLAKRAAMAQAELCARMGINFAVYAHSGNYHKPDYGRSEGMDLEIYHIKDPEEPWTDKVKERLNKIGPDSANLDGHTFEYYRKILDTRTETHRVILYYTDGKMPAENEAEELEILKREIKICRQRKYVLMGVGIRTDSPTQHGLDTVEVNGDEDVVKVVERLEKRLLEIM